MNVHDEASAYIHKKRPEWHDNGAGIVQGSHYRSGFADGAAWQAERSVVAEEPEVEWAIRSRIKHEYTGRENLPANRGWAFWRTGLSEHVARTEAEKYAPGYEVEVVRRRKAGPWLPASPLEGQESNE